MASSCKDARRAGRSEAVKSFNELAAQLELPRLPCRLSGKQMAVFWRNLCEAAQPEHHDGMLLARAQWAESGGEDLPVDLIQARVDEDIADQHYIENHQPLEELLPHRKTKRGGKTAFRFRSKAFLLTFNSITFTESKELWDNFLVWVGGQVEAFKATQWSASLERSLHSADQGRIHFHA